MSTADHLLLKRWIDARDATAFHELVSRHAGLVHGACRRVLRNAADAEDVAQECFLHLARSDSPPRAPLAGWLHRLATHRSLDRIKSERRRRRREERAAARTPDGREEAGWDEIRHLVDEAIAALPEKFRTVVVAHFLEQRPQDAIAAELGISRQTVTYRVSRGIERIRVHLRRRGVAVAAAALSTMLSAYAAEAAPPWLLAALGRMSLAGTTGVPATTNSILATVLGGIAIMTTTKIAAATAATIILVLLFIGWAVGPWSAPPDDAPGLAREDAVPVPPAAVEPVAPPAPEPAAPPDAAVAAEPLDASRVIRGRVVDPDGAVVAGARVAAGRVTRAEKLAEGTADVDGRFELELPEAGAFLLCAYAEGAGLAAVPNVETAAGEVEVVLDPLGAIRGRIVDRESGKGIDDLDFEVSVFNFSDRERSAAFAWFGLWGGGKPRRELGGRYRLEGLPAARYLFQFDVASSSYAVPGHDGIPYVDVVLVAGEEREDFDVALERGGALSGTVFDPAGRPLPGARVHLASSRHSFSERSAVTTDADGRYRFGALRPGGSFAVVADAEGLAQGHGETVSLATAEEITDVDVHLTEGHSVFGRIVDDDGTGVPGATFRLAKAYWRSLDPFGRDETVTAADGSFRIDGVSAGTYRFVPRAEGYDSALVQELVMPSDRDLRDQVFTIHRQAEGSVSGRVRDADGRPLERIRLVIHNYGRGAHVQGTVYTDVEGRYRFEGIGRAESFMVSVYPEDHAMEERTGVPLGANDVDFTLDRLASVTGRVVDAASGELVTDFEIRPISYRNRPDGLQADWIKVRAEDGAFLIDRIEPPESQIEVRAGGFAPYVGERFRIRPGELVETIVRLESGAAIGGRIVDGRTGEPIPGARVRAYAQGYFHSTLLSDEADTLTQEFEALSAADGEGAFALDGLDPGAELDLVAWHDGYGPQIVAAVAPPAELTIELWPEARLRASVVRGDAPVAAIALMIAREDFTPRGRGFRGGGATDAEGVAELSGIPGGRYRVVLQSSERRQLGLLWTDVRPGETTELALDLDELDRRLGRVAGTVAGAESFVGVWVSPVSSPEDRYGSTWCRPPDTAFRLAGIPPGEYVLHVKQMEPPREVERRLVLEAGREARADVTLE